MTDLLLATTYAPGDPSWVRTAERIAADEAACAAHHTALIAEWKGGPYYPFPPVSPAIQQHLDSLAKGRKPRRFAKGDKVTGRGQYAGNIIRDRQPDGSLYVRHASGEPFKRPEIVYVGVVVGYACLPAWRIIWVTMDGNLWVSAPGEVRKVSADD